MPAHVAKQQNKTFSVKGLLFFQGTLKNCSDFIQREVTRTEMGATCRIYTIGTKKGWLAYEKIILFQQWEVPDSLKKFLELTLVQEKKYEILIKRNNKFYPKDQLPMQVP